MHTAPWWTVATFHTVKRGSATVAEANLGTFGPATICEVQGGINDGADPSLFLGSEAAPMYCH